ncbi:hypothetical protein R6Q59_031734 [Mikania micrantha]
MYPSKFPHLTTTHDFSTPFSSVRLAGFGDILFLSPWDDILLRMLKTIVWWLFRSIRSIPVHEVVCLLNGNHDEEEAHAPGR